MASTNLAEIADIPLARFDLESGLVEWSNPTFDKWSGELGGNAAFKDCFELPENFAPEKLSLGGGAQILKVNAKGKRGRPFPAELKLKLLAPGKVSVEGRDLTEIAQKQMMLESFTKVIDNNNRQLRKTKEGMARLLDHMQQAVFALDESLNIAAPVSQYSRTLFGEDCEGASIYETVFSSLEPGGQERSMVESALCVVFGEPCYQWMMMENLLPGKIDYQAPGSQELRRLEINYVPIYDDDDELLRHILFVVRDVTEIERLESELEEAHHQKQASVRRIQEMAALDRAELEHFLEATGVALQSMSTTCEELGQVAGTVERLARDLHTLKGNARALGFTEISEVIHGVEQHLSPLVGQSADLSRATCEQLKAGVEEVSTCALAYSTLAHRIFGIDDQVSANMIKNGHRAMAELDLACERLASAQSKHEEAEYLHGIKRALKGVRGSIDAVNEPELSTCAKNFDEQVNAGEKPDIEAMLRHHAEFRRCTIKFFHRSRVLPAVPSQARVWENLVSGLLTIRAGLAEAKSDQSLARTIHSLNALCRAHGLTYLSKIFHLLEDEFQAEAKLQSCEGDPNRFMRISQRLFDEAWRWVAAFFHFDSCRHLDAKQLEITASSLTRSMNAVDEAPCLHFASALLSTIRKLSPGRERRAFEVEVRRSLGLTGQSPWPRLLEAPGESMAHIQVAKIVLESAEPTEPRPDPSHPGPILQLISDSLRFVAARDQLTVPAYLHGFDWLRMAELSSHETQAVYLPRTVQVVETELTRLLEDTSSADVRAAIGQLMRLPIGPTIERFRAMVDDISRALGKRVKLEVHGADVLVDRSLFTSLEDALVHILRNAVDHGIESEAQRLESGKSGVGTIRVDVREGTGGATLVQIRDDGRGIDADKVAARALERRLITSAQLEDMTIQDKQSLILLPGFSTTDDVTDISGRGVGMDAARAIVNDLGGEVRIETKLGRGTEITLDLPPPNRTSDAARYAA